MAERDLRRLLVSLRPYVHPGTYVFTSVPADAVGDLPDAVTSGAVVTVREPEGLTLVVARETADRHGLTSTFAAAWIILTAHSALDAVGLTAAVAAALTARGVSCNVVAGFHHDHLFVPADRVDDALTALAALSDSARGHVGG